MNACNMLESILKDMLEAVKPQKEDWDTRMRVINELLGVVQSVESLRGATLAPFGSFSSNLFSRWGDLDISIELPSESYVSLVSKKRKKSVLADVLRNLRHYGGQWHRLQFIPNARVPILKLESRPYSISCDISIDNIQGQMKSKFLLWIGTIDGRFREMVLLVKEWAKAHNINSPKTGTFNSYSLCLLVIFHFQTCVPAIFPPLEEIYPRNVVNDLTGVRETAEKRVAEICATNINRIRSNKSRPINRSSLSELFLSFLAKFSCIDSRAVDQGICPYTGRWEDIRTNMRWQPKTYAIFVEDPYEQPENTARSVSAGQLFRIAEAFRTTYHKLMNGHETPNSILISLVSSQALPLVVKTSALYQNYPGRPYSNPVLNYPNQARHYPNPVGNYSVPVRNYSSPVPVLNYTNPVKNYSVPVRNYSAPVRSYPITRPPVHGHVKPSPSRANHQLKKKGVANGQEDSMSEPQQSETRTQQEKARVRKEQQQIPARSPQFWKPKP